MRETPAETHVEVQGPAVINVEFPIITRGQMVYSMQDQSGSPRLRNQASPWLPPNPVENKCTFRTILVTQAIALRAEAATSASFVRTGARLAS